MEYTTNFQLKKPSAQDYYDIDDFNNNADVIDNKLAKGMEAYNSVSQLLTRISNLEQRATKLEIKGKILLDLYAMNGTTVSITQSGYTSQQFTISSTGYVRKEMPAVGVWNISYTYNSLSYSTKVNLDHIGVTVVALAPKLEHSSWAFIDKVGSLGLANRCWKVGDTKSLTVGTESMQVRILDFNHDLLWEQDSGVRKTAPITFALTDVLSTKCKMHSSSSANVAWGNRDMITTVLPARKLELTADLQSVIKDVAKVYMKLFEGEQNQGGGSASEGCELLKSDLFLLSEREIFGESRVSNPYYEYERAYEYFARGNDFRADGDYWMRSCGYTTSGAFKSALCLMSSGAVAARTMANEMSLLFGFCV